MGDVLPIYDVFINLKNPALQPGFEISKIIDVDQALSRIWPSSGSRKT